MAADDRVLMSAVLGQAVGAATSVHRDARIAARSAVRAALKQAGIQRPQLVLAFATDTYDQPALVAALREASGGAALAGCTGDSVIGPAGDVESTHAVAVQVWGAGPLAMFAASAEGAVEQPETAAAAVAEQLRGAGPRAVLCFADTRVDWPRFRAALAGSLGEVAIAGGLAGSGSPLDPAYQYGERAVTGGVSAVAFAGTGEVAVESSPMACAPVGRWFKTSRREGTTVYELDGRAAAEVIAEAIGPGCIGGGGEAPLGLALLVEESGRATLIRRVDINRGSIELAASVPGGVRVCLAISDGDRIRAAYERLASTASPARGVIQIETAGTTDGVVPRWERGRLLAGLRAPHATPAWIGLRGCGAIHARGTDDRHAHTTTLVTIR